MLPKKTEVQPLIAVHPQDKKPPQPLIDMGDIERRGIAIAAESPDGEFDSNDDQSWLPQNPQEFVESLWGLARQAGNVLKQNPKVILAQAALETGWGKFMISNEDGSNSFNLFGIKAGKSWNGAEARVSTLEYEGGVPERQTASFRSYDSLADSFKDYVAFLTQSPRYEQALASTDEQGFARGLQESGYATDPNYADKILSILSRPEFKRLDAVSNTKLGAGL